MFTTIGSFTRTWERESAQTARVLSRLTDEALSHRGAPDHRTVGEVAWHIVVSPRVIAAKLGLEVAAPDRDTPSPERAAETHSTYVDAATSFVSQVRERWTDSMLGEQVDFYGNVVARGEALATILHHEIHHRGQLTVLMRLAGLQVPGVYGPSKEEG